MPDDIYKRCNGCKTETYHKVYGATTTCKDCGWISFLTPHKESLDIRNRVKRSRLIKIKSVHEANPNDTQVQLAAFTPDTMHAVVKYWKDPEMNITTHVKHD